MEFSDGVSPDALALLAQNCTDTLICAHILAGRIYEGEWENDSQKSPAKVTKSPKRSSGKVRYVFCIMQ